VRGSGAATARAEPVETKEKASPLEVVRSLFLESARVVGKSTKPKADAAADTVTSPVAPPRSEEPPPDAIGSIESRSGVVPGARSSERIILSAGSKGIGQCLARHEVVAYLGPACPRDVRARVDAHIADCVPCGRWVRHVDDEILEYIGGQHAEEDLARMDAHLDACKICRELMHHVLQGMAQSWHGEQRDPSDAGTTFVAGNIVSSRYVIQSFVGRGGMGEVYEAFDRLMDRRIALKTMLCTAADRPRAARRFKEEVRNAQRVGHPHVCRINDLQEHNEAVFGPPLPFFTMEYVDGDRLGNRLLEGPLPLDDTRVIALQLLDGLRAAHQRGVLHLDFKSDNVMLRRNTAAPDAVIMDFGLSRVLGSESKLRTSDRRQFAGTLPYMSVEQLECRDNLGPATDVYAFGVVLYEMLTRTLPFDGETLGAILLKQLNERPKPPSRHVHDLSPALDRFVLKCLKSDPHSRYADAAQALSALMAIGSWSRPRGARVRRWTLVAAVSAVAVVAALVSVWSIRRSAPTGGTGSTDVSRLGQELAPAPSVPTPVTNAPVPVPSAAVAVSPPDSPGPVSPVIAPPAAKASARTSQGGARSEAATPRSNEAAAPTSERRTDAEPTPSALPPHGAASAGPASADDRDAWKPSRVPKRLHRPAPTPPRDADDRSADQNVRR
jgi:serine/threonine protein kinase